MRVGQTNSNPVQNSEVAKSRGSTKQDVAKGARSGASADAAGANEDVRADFSARAKEFAMAKTAATDAPDVHDAKIAELKRRIAAGSYHVDSAAIADKMVDEHLKTSEMG